eukprot:jgi/Mesvir1/12913/Mv05933-RA.3
MGAAESRAEPGEDVIALLGKTIDKRTVSGSNASAIRAEATILLNKLAADPQRSGVSGAGIQNLVDSSLPDEAFFSYCAALVEQSSTSEAQPTPPAPQQEKAVSSDVNTPPEPVSDAQPAPASSSKPDDAPSVPSQGADLDVQVAEKPDASEQPAQSSHVPEQAEETPASTTVVPSDDIKAENLAAITKAVPPPMPLGANAAPEYALQPPVIQDSGIPVASILEKLKKPSAVPPLGDALHDETPPGVTDDAIHCSKTLSVSSKTPDVSSRGTPGQALTPFVLDEGILQSISVDSLLATHLRASSNVVRSHEGEGTDQSPFLRWLEQAQRQQKNGPNKGRPEDPAAEEAALLATASRLKKEAEGISSETLTGSDSADGEGTDGAGSSFLHWWVTAAGALASQKEVTEGSLKDVHSSLGKHAAPATYTGHEPATSSSHFLHWLASASDTALQPMPDQVQPGREDLPAARHNSAIIATMMAGLSPREMPAAPQRPADEDVGDDEGAKVAAGGSPGAHGAGSAGVMDASGHAEADASGHVEAGVGDPAVTEAALGAAVEGAATPENAPRVPEVAMVREHDAWVLVEGGAAMEADKEGESGVVTAAAVEHDRDMAAGGQRGVADGSVEQEVVPPEEELAGEGAGTAGDEVAKEAAGGDGVLVIGAEGSEAVVAGAEAVPTEEAHVAAGASVDAGGKAHGKGSSEADVAVGAEDKGQAEVAEAERAQGKAQAEAEARMKEEARVQEAVRARTEAMEAELARAREEARELAEARARAEAAAQAEAAARAAAEAHWQAEVQARAQAEAQARALAEAQARAAAEARVREQGLTKAQATAHLEQEPRPEETEVVAAKPKSEGQKGAGIVTVVVPATGATLPHGAGTNVAAQVDGAAGDVAKVRPVSEPTGPPGGETSAPASLSAAVGESSVETALAMAAGGVGSVADGSSVDGGKPPQVELQREELHDQGKHHEERDGNSKADSNDKSKEEEEQRDVEEASKEVDPLERPGMSSVRPEVLGLLQYYRQRGKMAQAAAQAAENAASAAAASAVATINTATAAAVAAATSRNAAAGAVTSDNVDGALAGVLAGAALDVANPTETAGTAVEAPAPVVEGPGPEVSESTAGQVKGAEGEAAGVVVATAEVESAHTPSAGPQDQGAAGATALPVEAAAATAETSRLVAPLTTDETGVTSVVKDGGTARVAAAAEVGQAALAGASAPQTSVVVRPNGPKKRVAAGDNHCLALSEEGTLLAFGKGSLGRLGLGSFDDKPTPEVVSFGGGGGGATGRRRQSQHALVVAAGQSHSLAVTDDGKLWAWGDHTYGQLGLGTSPERLIPEIVSIPPPAPGEDAAAKGATDATTADASIKDAVINGSDKLAGANASVKVVDIAARGHMSAAVMEDGALWLWGRASHCLAPSGAPPSTSQPRPQMVDLPRRVLPFVGMRVVMVACGNEHVVAGVLGLLPGLSNGTSSAAATASTPVGTGAGMVASTSAGSGAQVELYVWGMNGHGQLGLGDKKPQMAPVLLPRTMWGGDDASARLKAVACGAFHTAILVTQGAQPTSSVRSPPTDATSSFAPPSLSTSSSAAPEDELTSCYTWGLGDHGQLGHGSLGSCAAPRCVKALVALSSQLRAVACGSFHTTALTEDGAVWVWGSKGGMGMVAAMLPDSATPQLFFTPPPPGFRDIACGYWHTLAVQDNGKIWTWGKGDAGVLGCGSPEEVLAPVCLDRWTPGEADKLSPRGLQCTAPAPLFRSDSTEPYDFGGRIAGGTDAGMPSTPQGSGTFAGSRGSTPQKTARRGPCGWAARHSRARRGRCGWAARRSRVRRGPCSWAARHSRARKGPCGWAARRSRARRGPRSWAARHSRAREGPCGWAARRSRARRGQC